MCNARNVCIVSMRPCMYLCMFVSACMYNVCMCLLCESVYACMCVRVCMCVCLCLRECITRVVCVLCEYVYACMCECVYVSMFVCNVCTL